MFEEIQIAGRFSQDERVVVYEGGCREIFRELPLWFKKSAEYIFNLDPIRVPKKFCDKKYFKGPRVGESLLLH
jgi:hypothetical protein